MNEVKSQTWKCTDCGHVTESGEPVGIDYCDKCDDVSVCNMIPVSICQECFTAYEGEKCPGVLCGKKGDVTACPRCGGAIDEEGLCATPDCEPVRGDAVDCDDSRAIVLGDNILHQLYDAGVIDSLHKRVIIDVAFGEVVKIYTQRFASEQFRKVLMGKPILIALAKAENVGDESCRNTEKATA